MHDAPMMTANDHVREAEMWLEQAGNAMNPAHGERRDPAEIANMIGLASTHQAVAIAINSLAITQSALPLMDKTDQMMDNELGRDAWKRPARRPQIPDDPRELGQS